MARFYGTVQGNRGQATRLGHHSLEVTAQSWNGDITVRFTRNTTDDTDMVSIWANGHESNSPHHCLFDGNIRDLLDMTYRRAQIEALGIEEFLKHYEESER